MANPNLHCSVEPNLRLGCPLIEVKFFIHFVFGGLTDFGELTDFGKLSNFGELNKFR